MPKPLVVAYHIAPSALAALGSAVEVRSIVAPPGQRNYDHVGAYVRPLGDQGRPVVLVGWSEGAQGVRTHLAAGDVKNVVGVISLDGASASRPPNDAAHLAPWRAALSGGLDVTLTSTEIPVTYTSTRQVIGLLGLPTARGTSEEDGGRVRVVNTAGTDAAAHVSHLRMAPAEVARILARHGLPGGSAAASSTGGGPVSLASASLRSTPTDESEADQTTSRALWALPVVLGGGYLLLRYLTRHEVSW